MYLIQIDGAQNVSRMCMCIELVIQVPRQKNAHVSFPVGSRAKNGDKAVCDNTCHLRSKLWPDAPAFGVHLSDQEDLTTCSTMTRDRDLQCRGIIATRFFESPPIDHLLMFILFLQVFCET